MRGGNGWTGERGKRGKEGTNDEYKSTSGKYRKVPPKGSFDPDKEMVRYIAPYLGRTPDIKSGANKRGP